VTIQQPQQQPHTRRTKPFRLARHFSSKPPTTSADDENKAAAGNEVYERAMLAFDAVKTFQQEREEKRNREQYNSYQNQRTPMLK
jgi:hypothetical protein